MPALVADVRPHPSPTTEPATPSSTYHAHEPLKATSSFNPFRKIARHWFALRWYLSRTVFSRPVPYLTTKLELKLGDLWITVPLALGFLAWSLYLFKLRDVRASGWPPTIMMILVFGLAIRNNALLLPLTGIPFERALFLHKFFGAVAIPLAYLHGIMFVVKSKNADTSAINKTYMGLERDISGWATFQCMLALTVLSFYKIRRRWFELFLRFHWVLFLAIIALAVIHGAAMVLVGVVPWALDVIFRYGIQVPLDQRRALHVGQVSVTTIAKDLVRIQLPRVRTTTGSTGAKTTRAFHYEARHYVFICIPRLSVLEWHPFTIGSAPPNDMVIIYIKVLGDWTKKLAELASSQPTDSQIAVLIEGPYGAVSIDFEHPTTYSHFVLVSGGIGMTPMMALANQLYFDASPSTPCTPRHDAVWPKSSSSGQFVNFSGIVTGC